MEETVKKQNHHHGNQNSFGGIFLGILLIFLGVFYFLRNFGIITFDIDIFSLWPVFIIFAGLSLINVRGWLGVLMGIILSFVIIGLLFSAFFFKSNKVIFSNNQTNPSNREISIDKSQSASRANINLKFGAGTINITSNNAEKLLSGKFESSISDINISQQIGAGTQRILLESSHAIKIFGKMANKLDLNIDDDLPVDFFLDAGATDSKINFEGIALNSMELKTGASNIDIALGDKQKESNIKVNAGASSIRISLPKNVGAKIKSETELTNKNFENFIEIDKNNWESLEYFEKEKKINIEIKAGVSNITMLWR